MTGVGGFHTLFTNKTNIIVSVRKARNTAIQSKVPHDLYLHMETTDQDLGSGDLSAYFKTDIPRASTNKRNVKNFISNTIEGTLLLRSLGPERLAFE